MLQTRLKKSLVLNAGMKFVILHGNMLGNQNFIFQKSAMSNSSKVS